MRQTLLYAEDEYTNRKIMEIQCRRFGVDCILASDGTEALEKCREGQFNLVILDQYMPGLNGDEVAKELASIRPDLSLVAITSDDACVPRLKSVGFDAVFVKPLRADDYRRLMEDHLG